MTGFSDGEPTNAAPLVAESSSRGSSTVLPIPKWSSGTQDVPVLPDREPAPRRYLLPVLLSLLLAGVGIVVWVIARSLRGSP